MKKYCFPILLAAAVLGGTLRSNGQVTLIADPADGYGISPAMFTLDPTLYNPGGRGVANTRQLRQTFQLAESIDVESITIGWTLNGNDGGIVIDFYEVDDVNANPIVLGTLVHSITISTNVDLPVTTAQLRVSLAGADVFSLSQRDAGTTGYAIQLSTVDQTTNLGNVQHSNNGVDNYTAGRFYLTDGGDSGNGDRDLGIALGAVFISPFPDLNWAVGNGTWDINTTASWNDGGGAAVYQETNGLGNNVTFEDTVSAPGDITVTLDSTVAPASTTADTAKTFSITGFGAIGGPGSITKTGSGTLSLLYTGFSDQSGLININEGVLEVSAGNLGEFALSPALINFNGGTLRFAPGNTSPFAIGQIVTFVGDATIDTGANSLFLTDPIGNGGPGGLTKTGTGSLNLQGEHTYTGNTVVSEGVLNISTATIAESAGIQVDSGATLEAAGLAQSLSASANQVLSGSGTVNVGISAPANTSVSPGVSGAGTLTFGSSSGLDGSLTLDGGTLVMDISNTTKDLIVANNTFTITPNGGNVVLNVTGLLANGTYTLISAPNGISGGIGGIIVSGFSQAGQIAFLTTSATTVDLVVANAGDANLTWTGSSSDQWDVENSANWTSNGVTVTFVQGDTVNFTSAGAGQPIVDLQGALFPADVIVDATTDYTLGTTAGGRISGGTGITKNNTGKLTILTDNNNFGVVTINAGTVEVGDGSATAHIGDGSIVNNASLVFNPAPADDRTVGAISGTGSVTQNGAAVISIGGEATYTGATTIGTGASLGFGAGGALGPIGTSGINNDGTVVYNSSSDQTLPPLSGSGGLTKLGTGTLTVNSLSSGDVSVGGGTLVLGGSLLGAGLTIDGGGSTLEINGFDQTVTSLNASGNGSIMNSAASGSNTLTIDVASDSNADVLILEGAGNVVSVVKSGAGIITRNSPGGSSTYSGGTLINGPGGFNIDQDDQLGTGPVIFDGGFITMNDQNDLVNPVQVLSVANYESRGNMQFRGPFTGDSSAVINMTGNADGRTMTFDPGGTMDDFLGTVNYAGTNSILARFRANVNGSQVTWNMGTAGTRFLTRNGQTVRLGHLTAQANNSMIGATSSDDPTTYVIGELGQPIDFPGTVADQYPDTGPVVNLNRWVGITKAGNGTMTLSGTNLYSGPTAVTGGTLAVSAVGGLDNSRAITVGAGATLDVTGLGGTLTIGSTTNTQTLGGAGTITGNVVASGVGPTIIAPGDSAGELTISGSLTLAANSTVEVELDNSASPTSDLITAASITGAGTVTVTNVGPLLSVGEVFTLFSQPVGGLSFSGTGSDAVADYTFDDRLATAGEIEVLSVAPKFNLTPTNMMVSVSGGSVTLSWPASHAGWILQGQTNTLGDGLTTNWVDLGFANTNSVTYPLDLTDEAVFYRLRLP